MHRDSKLLDRIVWAADLPEESLPGQPIVEIVGQRRVLIENHRGVIEYTDSIVRVKVKYGAVCIAGAHLELSRMTKGQLIVSGCIDSVKLERR